MNRYQRDNLIRNTNRVVSRINSRIGSSAPLRVGGIAEGEGYDDSLYSETDKYMIMTPQQRGDLDLFREARLVAEAFEDKIINYVAAILDPEYNYNTGVMVKQPSLLNPPSISVPIKTLTTIKSEGKSSICISWNPFLFCTKQDLGKIVLAEKSNDQNKRIYANQVSSVLYSLSETTGLDSILKADSWNSKVFAIPDNLPDIGVSKARLVSAKIKISFRGTIYNQGGTVMGAATFEGPPGLVLNTGDDGRVWMNGGAQAKWSDLFKVSLGDQFSENSLCPFEEKVISNGIWAKNVNITENANGISAVFIPTDPMDEVFYKPGTYYGEQIAVDKNMQDDWTKATSLLYSAKGARLNYLFNIQGLNTESNPIVVETYTTWECLPTNQSASVFRNTNMGMNNLAAYEKVKDLISTYMGESSGLHTVKKNNLGGLFSKLKSLASKAWKGIKANLD